MWMFLVMEFEVVPQSDPSLELDLELFPETVVRVRDEEKAFLVCYFGFF
jgi:hypothetical protein